MHRRENIFCIVVTFNPDTTGLQKTITSILENDVELIIVDNGSSNQNEIDELVSKLENTTLVRLNKNLGIAFAQNTGIKAAQDKGADFIWISDQDTTYPPDYIYSMLKCISNFGSTDQIAAFGPAFIDTNRKTLQPFTRFSPFFKRFTPQTGPNEVSHLIASGMLIPANAFHKVGLKNEDLFIDLVDMEWCWRASKLHEMKIIGCGDVVISHTLGDVFVSILGRKISIRSPFRHYFIIRNAFALALHSRHLTLTQRIYLLYQYGAYALIYPILAHSEKIKHLKSVYIGLLHGITNKLGPKP